MKTVKIKFLILLGTFYSMDYKFHIPEKQQETQFVVKDDYKEHINFNSLNKNTIEIEGESLSINYFKPNIEEIECLKIKPIDKIVEKKEKKKSEEIKFAYPMPPEHIEFNFKETESCCNCNIM